MASDEVMRIYYHLLYSCGLNADSPKEDKLSSQRTIYRIYNEEVDGYKNSLDVGYYNGIVPNIFKKEK